MSHIFSRINPLYLHIRCRHRELRDSFHIVIVVIVFILQILCSRIIHREHKELVDQAITTDATIPKIMEPADTGRLKLKSPIKITASCVITPATMAMDQE